MFDNEINELLKEIGAKLLKIVKNELKEEKAPSKELLDTLKAATLLIAGSKMDYFD